MDPCIDDLWYYDLHDSSYPPSDEGAPQSLDPFTQEGSPQMQQLHKIFDSMDADHDGELSGSELCQWMKNLGLRFTEEGMLSMVDHSDVRRCGSLDFKEFVGLVKDIDAEEEAKCTRDTKEDAHRKLLIEVFRVFDRDNDGRISPKELAFILQEIGLVKKKRLDSDYADMIKRVDLDGDGQVSFSEFQSMMDQQKV